MEHRYKFSPYVHFLLTERGKIRPIDAPRIQDRQVEKAYTQDVLLALYLPSMIWNNGASLPGKGFAFSKRMMVKELTAHFRKYGRSGWLILTDAEKYFPSAPHDRIYQRHRDLILDPDLKEFGDSVIRTVPGSKGMPLGVEPSQAEMIALPSPLDNYIKCQLGLKGAGHYMDDYHILVPPDRDPKEVLALIKRKAAECGVTISDRKTQIVPLYRPFRYCKAKYYLSETGHVVTRANKTALPRDRRKLKAFHEKVKQGKMSLEDLWTSVNGMLSYLEDYDEHNHILELRRLFFSLFGFSCEKIDYFRRQAAWNTSRSNASNATA